MSTAERFHRKVMAGRPALREADRQRLVGLRPRDPSKRLYAGAHLLPVGAAHLADNDQGVITSVAFSPSLQHWIGLACWRADRSGSAKP